MPFNKVGGDLFVAFFGFYTFGYHGLIAYQQQRAGWNFVIETYGKDGGSFHINGHGPYLLQVFLKVFIMFPYPAVSCIYGAGPVVNTVIANGGGNCFLQGESG